MRFDQIAEAAKLAIGEHELIPKDTVSTVTREEREHLRRMLDEAKARVDWS